MFLEGNRLIHHIIKKLNDMKNFIQQKLQTHKTLKTWLWFIFLWCGGLFAALLLAYGTKSLYWLGKMLIT